MWDHCGMARSRRPRRGIQLIGALRGYWRNVKVPGEGDWNQSLEQAGRVPISRTGQLLCRDAHQGCGGHFREGINTAADPEAAGP